MSKRGRKPDQARRDMIARLRESGYTLDAIGKALNPPVTREAVRQVLEKIHAETLDKGAGEGAK